MPHWRKLNVVRTRNFTLEEAIHRPETFPQELLPIAYIALGYLQSLRDNLGIPLIVQSGYRDKFYNQHIGGVPTSYHVWHWAEDGSPIFAFDITSPSVSAKDLFKAVSKMVNGECYLHEKLQFVHLAPVGLDQEWIG